MINSKQSKINEGELYGNIQVVTRLRPPALYVPLDLRELWLYRNLLLQLAWRDIRVRYKQSVIGVFWVLLQPVMAMGVFTVFFGRFGGMDDKVPNGIPYHLFVLCALVPWQMFSAAITQSGGSVVANRALITKVYFPRLLIPMVPLVSSFVDFVVGFSLLLLVMIWLGCVPTLAILLLPFFVALGLASALAVGVWLSALNALFRDVQHTLGFLAQFWMLATPIAYPSSIVPERWRYVYSLNPMVAVIDGFRFALLGSDAPSFVGLATSCCSVTLLLVAGLYFFRRIEVSFADRI